MSSPPRVLCALGSLLVAAPALLAADVAAAPPQPKPNPVTALAWSPDGARLAAGGRRELLLLGSPTQPLAHRVAAPDGVVTALAWSPDGSHLAVGVSQPGLRGELLIWRAADLPNGAPSVTVRAHRDSIAGIAWSPDGKTLATASYDKLVKLWAADGKPGHVLRDHSDSVYAVAFHKDGKLLATAAADRTVKVWRTADGVRLYTLAEATDWLYAVAWSPDGRFLAAGGVDRSLRVWQADDSAGKLVAAAFAHEGAVTALAFRPGNDGLLSVGEDRVLKLWDTAELAAAAATGKVALGEKHVFPAQPDTVQSLAVAPDGARVVLGRHDGSASVLDLATGQAVASPLPAELDPFVAVSEAEPNDSRSTAQAVALSATVTGRLDRDGDTDHFAFDAAVGTELGVRVVATDKSSKLKPVLSLIAADGRVLSEGVDDELGVVLPTAGRYVVRLRDAEYRGATTGFGYRLSLGAVPVITEVFPLGLRQGTTAEVAVSGVNLGGVRSVSVSAAAPAAVGTRLPVRIKRPDGQVVTGPSVVVGELPEVVADGSNTSPKTATALPVPGTAEGRFLAAGSRHLYRFVAKKGSPLIAEVQADRLGGRLDSIIEVLHPDGRPVERAVIRCLAKTVVTLRDVDPRQPGIRLESDAELAMRDDIWLNGELIRMRLRPPQPDADAQFVAVGGRRVGFLDTTPTAHAFGETMYKVLVAPPGSKFSPNGMPIFRVFYRNDDAQPGSRDIGGSDSRLTFDPPTDGEYLLAISDVRGRGGEGFGYRLTLRAPRPDFAVSVGPRNPTVALGSGVALNVSIERFDGFNGAVELRVEDVPSGFAITDSRIDGGEELATVMALAAAADAKAPAKTAKPMRLLARARIDGQEVVRTAELGLPTIGEVADVRAAVNHSELRIVPGKSAWIRVTIQRQKNFKGRVPIEVRGLPYGVRVLDVGLNGILITEAETERDVEIYCEPWVAPQEQAFLVTAKKEGGAEHAPPPVLLKVVAESAAPPTQNSR